jgi:hypothetical protein
MTWRSALAALVALAGLATGAGAQTVEVSPFVGYRFGGDLYEVYTAAALDFDGGAVVGGVVDVFVERGLSFSFVYAHQEAEVETVDSWGEVTEFGRLAVDHWHAGGTQEFGAGAVRPLLIGTIGLTRFGAPGDSELRFSMAAGGGVKLMPTRHLGVRLDGRVYAVFVNGSTGAGVCGGAGCLVGVDVSVVWQAEFTAGLVLSF